jgi:hypothetical protein
METWVGRYNQHHRLRFFPVHAAGDVRLDHTAFLSRLWAKKRQGRTAITEQSRHVFELAA